MGYYVRVLSTSADCVSLSALQSMLAKDKLQATLSAEEGASDDWAQLILSHADGREIASIERNLVEGESLGSDELAEFAEEVADCQPANAAKWLVDYFPRVRCIYAFQVLSGTDHKNGWEILDAVKSCIWSAAPSILQADNEGFSNEEGYHILWQFSDSMDGDWWMAVLHDGHWNPFQMDLGNRKQRESFFQGQIPAGATLPSRSVRRLRVLNEQTGENGMRNQPHFRAKITLQLCLVVLATAIVALASPESRQASSGGEQEKRVREFVEAFNARKLDVMLELTADNIQWMHIDGAKVSVEVEGKAALRESMERYFSSCSSCRSSLEWVQIAGSRVTAMERASWVGKGGAKSQRSLSVYEFRGDKILRVYYFPVEADTLPPQVK